MLMGSPFRKASHEGGSSWDALWEVIPEEEENLLFRVKLQLEPLLPQGEVNCYLATVDSLGYNYSIF